MQVNWKNKHTPTCTDTKESLSKIVQSCWPWFATMYQQHRRKPTPVGLASLTSNAMLIVFFPLEVTSRRNFRLMVNIDQRQTLGVFFTMQRRIAWLIKPYVTQTWPFTRCIQIFVQLHNIVEANQISGF